MPQKQDRVDGSREKDTGATGTSGNQAKVLKQGKKIKEDIDRLVDEIDSVLEENAEEFMKSYVQKGGE